MMAIVAPVGDIEARLAAARRHVDRVRRRLVAKGGVDLSGLEDCLRTLYEGAKALPPARARRVIDALVALEREVSALAVETAAYVAAEPSSRRPAGRPHLAEDGAAPPADRTDRP